MKLSLILLHGAIGSKDQFVSLAERLKEEFELFSFNFSGHGGGDITADFSIPLFAAELKQFIQDHNISSPNIFGYSMGGYVATYLAAKEPLLVGRIFCLATKWSWSPDIANREIKMLDSTVIEQKLPAFARILKDRHAPGNWKTVLQKTAIMMTEMGNRNPISENDFSQIKTLIRVTVGDKDKMVSAEETITTYKKLQNASLLILPDTPHPIEQMDLDRISFELRSFFKA